MNGQSIVAGLLATALLSFGGSAYRKTEQGNEQYVDGLYDDALRSYTEAQVDLPEAAELYYDIGNVLYRQADFEGATEAYTRALQSAPEELAGPAVFNLGNARFRQGEFQAAVEAFEQALRADSTDPDAKRNLELALRALDEQRRQQQQDQEEQEPEQPQPEEEEEEQPPEEEPQPPETGEQEPDLQMTPEQAERLLEGLEEQELENLRRQALQAKPAPIRTTGRDW